MRAQAGLPSALRTDTPLQESQSRQTAQVERTFLFSLRENAIAKEPGSSYLKPWRCVSRLGLVNGGLDSFESSP